MFDVYEDEEEEDEEDDVFVPAEAQISASAAVAGSPSAPSASGLVRRGSKPGAGESGTVEERAALLLRDASSTNGKPHCLSESD